MFCILPIIQLSLTFNQSIGMHTHFTYVLCHYAIEVLSACTNETPTVHGLAADNNNKVY